MTDRHDRGPVSFRPHEDTAGWLRDIAAREGRAVQQVVIEAVERARIIDEAGLAALDREQTRALTAWHRARAAGGSGDQEMAAFEAVNRACMHAIRQWQPGQDREGA